MRLLRFTKNWRYVLREQNVMILNDTIFMAKTLRPCPFSLFKRQRHNSVQSFFSPKPFHLILLCAAWLEWNFFLLFKYMYFV